MLILPEHLIFSSFKEWFSHTLLDEGRAFFNVTSGTLYSGIDPKLNTSVFAAPYHQWVYDSSVSGAIVPTTGTWGVQKIDFNYGRTIGSAPTGIINYSVKEFNIYTATSSDQALIFEQKYFDRPRPNTRTPTGATPYQIVAPCIFIVPAKVKADEFQLGGGKIMKRVFIECLIVSDDDFKRFGVGNLFIDKKNDVFPILSNTPLNEIGGIKGGSYNYIDQQLLNNTPSRLVHIEDVQYSPIDHDLITRNHPNLFFGKLYFNLLYYKDLTRENSWLGDEDSPWLGS